ncbi:MAG: hypothetical protein Kow00122_18400 [Thermoleophilia bacterium]
MNLPLMKELRPGDPGPRPTKPFGFNVIGYLSGDLGLGVSARNTVDTLLSRGEPVRVVDIVPPRGPGSEKRFDHLRGRPGEEAPYAINLFHLTPPEIARLAYSRPSWLDLRGGFNVCVPFWELPRFPLPWLPPLKAMDLVLAPSRFIAAAARTDLGRVPCVYHPQSVRLPPGVEADRARWGLPQDAVVFLVSFDANSDVERKNPWAAIEAFRRAAPSMPGALLLIKMLVRGAEGSAAAHIARLEEVAASVQGIKLLREELSYADAMSLYASADVVVSTHRSEGLGLVLMEAMSLGKAVIATGWSGNMDFTTAENSRLLEPRLTRVHGSLTQYSRLYVGRNVSWADVDVDEVARHMIALARDPLLRARLGARARLDMEARHARVARGDFVDDLVPFFRQFCEKGATGGRSALARSAALAALPAWHAVYRTASDTYAGLRSRGRPQPVEPGAGTGHADPPPASATAAAVVSGAQSPTPGPLVSILTPSFNQAPWLAENLRSVQIQTYSPIEHIVMDGSSTDGSVELLRRAEGPVRWTSEPDAGQAHALNRALEQSRGEIIGWLNSDDAYFDRGVVQAVVEFFADHPEVDVVYGHGAFVNAAGKVLLMIYVPPFSHRLLRRYCFLLQPSVFLRRRALQGGFVDQSYDFTMDWELWLRLAREGRRFARLDRVLAIDRLQPQRKTVTARDVFQRERERLVEAYGLPQNRLLGLAVPALYVGLRLLGVKLLFRPRRDLAFQAGFDRLPQLLRRQVATRRARMPATGGDRQAVGKDHDRGMQRPETPRSQSGRDRTV